MNRAEALKIWEWISKGILEEYWNGDSPSEEYVIAHDFIKTVAKDILSADDKKVDRGNAMIRAVKLQGKYTKHELEVLRIIELMKDFSDFYEPDNHEEPKKKIFTRFAIDYIRSIQKTDSKDILKELSLDKSDEELRKIIDHLRKK